MEPYARIHDDLRPRESRAKRTGMAQHRCNAPRLHDAEDNRQVTRNLRKLLTPGLTFLLHLLQRGDDG